MLPGERADLFPTQGNEDNASLGKGWQLCKKLLKKKGDFLNSEFLSWDTDPLCVSSHLATQHCSGRFGDKGNENVKPAVP